MPVILPVPLQNSNVAALGFLLCILCSLTCANLPLLILQGINVMAEPGTLTALVGGSGAGKTVGWPTHGWSRSCLSGWVDMFNSNSVFLSPVLLHADLI